MVTYVKYHAVDIKQLRTYILKSDLVISENSTLYNLVEHYNVCLTYPMDKHAPVRSKVFTGRSLTPLYKAKNWNRKRRCLYRRTKLTPHKDIYRAARLK